MNFEYLKIRYYLIPFVVMLFSLVIFENYFLFLCILFIFLLIYIFLTWKFKDLNFLIILFSMACMVLLSYLFFKYKVYDNIGGYKKSFIKKELKIIDYLPEKSYLAEDDFGGVFILKNTSGHKLGDIVKVYGMLYPTKLEFETFNDFIHKKFFSLNVSTKNFKNIFNFRYEKYLIMKGISGVIYSRKDFFIKHSYPGYFSLLKENLIKKIKEIYKDYDDKYKALILGLLIGDKSLLSKKIYENFIHSGLVHIIVVSGGNIMFLIIFLSFTLFFIPFYLRLIFIALIIIFYFLIVGADSSVLRAVIIGILSLLALFLGKLTDTRRLLAIAFMIMLVYNPYFLLYDLGFILSFSAILGILFFNKFLISTKGSLLQIPIFLYNNYVLPSIGAFVGVFPALLLFTKQVNLFAFISSILVVPIVPLLMIDNILVLFLSNLSSYFTNWIVVFNIYLMNWIFYVSDLFGDKLVLFLKI